MRKLISKGCASGTKDPSSPTAKVAAEPTEGPGNEPWAPGSMRPKDFAETPTHAPEGSLQLALREGQAGEGKGQPLGGPLRTKMSAWLDAPLPDVRIHRGVTAQRAVSALGAAAFTVGRDIFLGREVEESVPRGQRLLAHELAHAIQQSHAPPAGRVPLARTSPDDAQERQADGAARGLARPTPGAVLAIAAAPQGAPPFPVSKRFKEIWPDFEQAQAGSNPVRAKALAQELVNAPYDFDDMLNHGIELADWLQGNNEPELAARVLGEVRTVWMIRFVSKDPKDKLPARSASFSTNNDPLALIVQAKAAARAGKHEEAFRFFGVAHELLSYYAIQASEERTQQMGEDERREAELRKKGDAQSQALLAAAQFPRMIQRGFQYSSLQSLYDAMREIYGFYSVLEKEALAAGDAKGAAEAQSQASKLHKELKEKYSWGETQQPGPISQEVRDPVETAEVSYTDTIKGPGLTLHGANSAETDLTALPGLPSPKEIGNDVQIQNIGALQDALRAQTDFQGEIGRQPEIRKAFGNDPVDLSDTKKRQKVWQIMYGVFKRSGNGALGALMSLVGRYLKAYTIHTTYNVRDWGKSYLDSTLPTDLAGRAEKDCGVYALTVAWDVYQTVKHSDAKLDVSFDLTTMLEHVTLVITDKSAGEYYIVNNDFVSSPQKGDPLEQVAPQYGAIRGLPYAVGPAMTMSLGSSRDPEKKFHDDAWTRYLAAVDWGLRLDIPADVQALEKTNPAEHARRVLAIQEARYKKFYGEQEEFDKGAKALDPQVDLLWTSANDAAKLAQELARVVDTAGPLLALFVQLGPAIGVNAGSKKSQSLLPKESQYLFTMEAGHSVHPLARVALAILHLSAIGGTLTAKEAAFVQICDKVPQFSDQMRRYKAAGARDAF